MPDLTDEPDDACAQKLTASELHHSLSTDGRSPSTENKGSQASPTGADAHQKKKRKVNHGTSARERLQDGQMLTKSHLIACVYCRRSVGFSMHSSAVRTWLANKQPALYSI